MVVLDTSVIIDHLRTVGNRQTAFETANANFNDSLGASIITIQELYAGKSTLNKSQEGKVLLAINALKILSHTHKVARLAGVLTRDIQRGLDFADAAIAATAIVNRAELLTLNIKHFRDIPGLKLFKM